MEGAARPLDALNETRGKNVIVDLKNGCRYTGKLKAFDIHINVVLEEAAESRDGEVKRNLGKVFIRGDTITIITPA
jgi:small nuclear ribonucleoprotein